jgi:hypothetical protein
LIELCTHFGLGDVRKTTRRAGNEWDYVGVGKRARVPGSNLLASRSGNRLLTHDLDDEADDGINTSTVVLDSLLANISFLR